MSGLVDRMSRVWPWFFAVLSGLLLALCYAPFGWGNLCWAALTPLTVALWLRDPAPRQNSLRAAGFGFVCGLVYFGGSLFWLTTLTTPGWALLAIYLAVYPALWAMFLGIIRPVGLNRKREPVWMGSIHNLRICLLGASAWVGLETVRGFLFTGFGWNALGVALNKNIPLIQITDITGVGGVSFLVVFANLMAVATVKRLVLEVGRGARRPHYDFALTVALIALIWAYGVRQMMAPAPDTTALTFAAVQANVPQATRNDPNFEFDVLEKYRRLTETAIAMQPDLILWPESAPPRPLFNDQRTWETVRELAESHAGDILIGTVHFSEQGDFNSVVLLTNHAKSAQMYHKMHLVPFGEYVPFRSGFPLFAWVVGDLVPDDFDPGPYPEILEMAAKPVRIGPLVCFEDTLGNLARQFAIRGAQLFAVVTNDGWFLESAGSRQHLQNAIFRCAENKIPMIRAANTGVTCLVDRFGVVREELRSEDGNTFIEGILFHRVEVPKNPSPTFYARNGDVFSFVCLAVSLATICVFSLRRWKNKDSACPNPNETKISHP